jgi:hypothetical protein
LTFYETVGSKVAAEKDTALMGQAVSLHYYGGGIMKKVILVLLMLVSFSTIAFADQFDFDLNNKELNKAQMEYDFLQTLVGKELWIMHGGIGVHHLEDNFIIERLDPLTHVIVKSVTPIIAHYSLDYRRDCPIDNTVQDDGLKDYSVYAIIQTDDGRCFSSADVSNAGVLSLFVSLANPYEDHPDWSDRAWQAIKSKQVYIGMNQEMCLMSKGEPRHINATTTTWGDHDQWVYGTNEYLYFDDGILSAIQN